MPLSPNSRGILFCSLAVGCVGPSVAQAPPCVVRVALEGHAGGGIVDRVDAHDRCLAATGSLDGLDVRGGTARHRVGPPWSSASGFIFIIERRRSRGGKEGGSHGWMVMGLSLVMSPVSDQGFLAPQKDLSTSSTVCLTVCGAVRGRGVGDARGQDPIMLFDRFRRLSSCALLPPPQRFHPTHRAVSLLHRPSTSLSLTPCALRSAFFPTFLLPG